MTCIEKTPSGYTVESYHKDIERNMNSLEAIVNIHAKDNEDYSCLNLSGAVKGEEWIHFEDRNNSGDGVDVDCE